MQNLETGSSRYTLVICEKPDAARRVAEALSATAPVSFNVGGVLAFRLEDASGKKYVVCAALGHLYGVSDTVKDRGVYPVFDLEWFPIGAIDEKAPRQAASRIRAVMRPADTAARVGGDEFVLLCETMEATAADAFMSRLRAAFREPIVAGAVEITLRLSVGMATTDDSAVTPASLIANADRAMYQAKRNEASDNV